MSRPDNEPFDTQTFIKELETHVESTPGLTFRLDKNRLSGNQVQYRYLLQGELRDLIRVADEIDKLAESGVVHDSPFVLTGFGDTARMLVGVIITEEQPKIKRIKEIPDFLEFIKDLQTTHPDLFRLGERNVNDDR